MILGKWRVSVAEAMEKLPRPGGERYAKVLEHGTLEIEIYAPRGTRSRRSRTRATRSTSSSRAGASSATAPNLERFGPGDVLFVPAHEEHRFETFTDDLVVWVMFYGPEGGEAAMGRRP